MRRVLLGRAHGAAEAARRGEALEGRRRPGRACPAKWNSKEKIRPRAAALLLGAEPGAVLG